MFVKKFVKNFIALADKDERKQENALWWLLTWALLFTIELLIVRAQGFNSPWSIIIPLIFVQVVIGLWSDFLTSRRLKKRSRARHKRNMQKLNDGYLWFEEE